MSVFRSGYFCGRWNQLAILERWVRVLTDWTVGYRKDVTESDQVVAFENPWGGLERDSTLSEGVVWGRRLCWIAQREGDGQYDRRALYWDGGAMRIQWVGQTCEHLDDESVSKSLTDRSRHNKGMNRREATPAAGGPDHRSSTYGRSLTRNDTTVGKHRQGIELGQIVEPRRDTLFLGDWSGDDQ